MLQSEAICTSPSTALTAKNVTMIGLNRAATRAVPRLCAANRRTRMTTVAGRTYVREIGVELLQSFESGEDGNRRRDHRVSRKQRRPGDAKQKSDRRPLPKRALRQRHQGQDAALALVVGLHQEQHIFRGDDNQQRPDDQGNDADDLGRAERAALELAERRLQRVERARADIAENDADRAERKHPEMSRRNASGRPRRHRLAAGRRPSKWVGTCVKQTSRSPAAAGP